MAATEPSHPSSHQQPSIPRVQCPRCGAIMRLAIVDHRGDDQPDQMTFDCQCGFVYHGQTERARPAR